MRDLYAVVCVFLATAFLAGRFLERVSLSRFSAFLVWVGSLWLGAVVYALLLVAGVDILLLLNRLVGAVSPSALAGTGPTAFLVGAGVIVVIVIAGYINAAFPRLRSLDLTIRKHFPGGQLRIVSVSDIHLGTIVCKARLQRIVKKMNELDPDLVLLPGDVVDEDIRPVIEQNLGETLLKIRSRLGVFAVTGNHEYFGGVENACTYLNAHGVRMLRDEVTTLENGLVLAGREDLSFNRGGVRRRKTVADLLSGIDKTAPIVLMDHQPFHLEEAGAAGVDLQLSGHTHHGQLWPFNFITKRVYELSWGYLLKGAMHVYVSCGVGTWGPPMRTGNTPEIMHITLRFSNDR